MSVVAGALGILALAFAAAAVFLKGPPLLVRGARVLAVASLATSLVGLASDVLGGSYDPTQRGGQGSLLASAGLLLVTFGAARAAERRRARLDRERWMAERK